MILRAELERPADELEAVLLGLGEARLRVREDRGRVHHRFVEIEREEVVAEVVVRRDVPARGALAVTWHSPERPLERGQQRVEPLPPSVERPQVPAGDPNQRDQVLAIPETVAIRLTEAD